MSRKLNKITEMDYVYVCHVGLVRSLIKRGKLKRMNRQKVFNSFDEMAKKIQEFSSKYPGPNSLIKPEELSQARDIVTEYYRELDAQAARLKDYCPIPDLLIALLIAGLLLFGTVKVGMFTWSFVSSFFIQTDYTETDPCALTWHDCQPFHY